MQAAKRRVVPRVGEFRVNRVGHILTGVEERAACVRVIATSPRTPIEILWPGHFAEHKRVGSAVGKCSQRIIKRNHIAAVPASLTKGALRRAEAKTLIDALDKVRLIRASCGRSVGTEYRVVVQRRNG